jgi:tetrahydromethanopterin S-methyltransferase subunit G
MMKILEVENVGKMLDLEKRLEIVEYKLEATHNAVQCLVAVAPGRDDELNKLSELEKLKQRVDQLEEALLSAERTIRRMERYVDMMTPAR